MFTTTLSGEDKVITRLKFFNKEAWKELQAGVKEGGEIIAADSRSLIPTRAATGWGTGGRLGWSQSTVASSIKVSFRSRTKGGVTGVGARVGIGNAAGALWSMAGSKTDTQFGSLMNAMHGEAKGPRALSPSWRANIDRVREHIQDAIDRAAKEASG